MPLLPYNHPCSLTRRLHIRGQVTRLAHGQIKQERGVARQPADQELADHSR
jgi:hypothetical protein